MNFQKLGMLVKAVLRHPKSLNAVLSDESVWQAYCADKYAMPKGLPEIDFHDLLGEIDLAIDPYSFLGDTSTPLDLALLVSLAKKIPDCDYFEIGTHRGESIANVAKVAKSCTSLSLSVQEMRAMGYSEGYITNQNFFLPKDHQIKLIGHNSQTFDFTPLLKSFDLIFVDGDHSYEGVKIDTANAFKLLKDDNSILVWHDYSLNTERIRWSVMAGILDAAPEDKRGNLYHVSNTMCAIFVPGQITTRVHEQGAVPNKVFKVAIKSCKLS